MSNHYHLGHKDETILSTSRAALTYLHPPSHILRSGGIGSTFLVVYLAPIASMDSTSNFEIGGGMSDRGGDGVDDISRGLPE